MSEPKYDPDKLRCNIHFRNSGAADMDRTQRLQESGRSRNARTNDFGGRVNCHTTTRPLLSLVLVRRVTLQCCPEPSGKRALCWLPMADWPVPRRRSNQRLGERRSGRATSKQATRIHLRDRSRKIRKDLETIARWLRRKCPPKGPWLRINVSVVVA